LAVAAVLHTANRLRGELADLRARRGRELLAQTLAPWLGHRGVGKRFEDERARLVVPLAGHHARDEALARRGQGLAHGGLRGEQHVVVYRRLRQRAETRAEVADARRVRV